MTTLETITQELDRIRLGRDSGRCHATVNIEIVVSPHGIQTPVVEIAAWDKGSLLAEGQGPSLTDAWRAFQADLNGPDAKALIRLADAEMGNPPDQAAGLRERVAEKAPHRKAALWNWLEQTPGCWAVSKSGKCYYVGKDAIVVRSSKKVSDLDHPGYVPNTWPIPESAKAQLRELGVPFDEAAAVEKGSAA